MQLSVSKLYFMNDHLTKKLKILFHSHISLFVSLFVLFSNTIAFFELLNYQLYQSIDDRTDKFKEN